MQIFARLTKVNEADRTIEGVIASEAVDRSGEVFDYAKSKPNFQKWSEELGKATGGKNIGNVRAMHGNVSAGITKAMHFDDAAKQIVVTAEITDANEWNKVLKGNYTGLSIGGRYAEKWTDEALGKTRYAADPSEYSLVDLPCNPDATFSVVKADGGTELHKFEHTTDHEALAKWADGLSAAEADVLSKRIAAREDVDPKDGKDKYGAVKFADPTNKKYPIDTAAHIRAAWNYIHMPKNAAKYSADNVKEIKAKIVAAWKDKIDPKGPPEAEKFSAAVLQKMAESPEAQVLAKAARALLGETELEKGLYTVAVFAQLLEQLAAIADGTVFETEAEGDDSKLPEQMAAALKPIAAAFLAMANEETNEALHGQLNDDASMALAARTPMEKRGAKHSAATKEHFKAMREHHKAMGEHLDALEAKPDEDDDDDGAQKLAKAADGLQKMTAERDTLAKAVAERDEMLLKAVERIDQQGALIKKLEELPAPSKATIYAVSKAAEAVGKTETEVQPVLKADGTVDDAATAIRKALQNPVRTR
jgi:hypothetical protein